MDLTDVLIIDDNETLTATFEKLLSDQGYRVATACDGNEAIEVFRDSHAIPKIAVVDLLMPNLDGPEIIEVLLRRCPDLQVIAISGQTLSPYFGRLADLGVRHFLQKPFGFDELLEAIRGMQEAA